MNNILLILVISIMNLLCFYFGAKIGQKVVRNEEIKPIIPNPIDAIEKRQEKLEQEKENEIIDTIMHNIDVYDGSPIGQKDIPKR